MDLGTVAYKALKTERIAESMPGFRIEVIVKTVDIKLQDYGT